MLIDDAWGWSCRCCTLWPVLKMRTKWRLLPWLLFFFPHFYLKVFYVFTISKSFETPQKLVYFKNRFLTMFCLLKKWKKYFPIILFFSYWNRHRSRRSWENERSRLLFDSPLAQDFNAARWNCSPRSKGIWVFSFLCFFRWKGQSKRQNEKNR